MFNEYSAYHCFVSFPYYALSLSCVSLVWKYYSISLTTSANTSGSCRRLTFSLQDFCCGVWWFERAYRRITGAWSDQVMDPIAVSLIACNWAWGIRK